MIKLALKAMIDHREAQSNLKTGSTSLRYSFDRIILKFPLINVRFSWISVYSS